MTKTEGFNSPTPTTTPIWFEAQVSQADGPPSQAVLPASYVPLQPLAVGPAGSVVPVPRAPDLVTSADTPSAVDVGAADESTAEESAVDVGAADDSTADDSTADDSTADESAVVVGAGGMLP